ncbi:MAG: hypothetical protein IPM83_16755 [Ignavibacteria bacterium]|nr:hypothetical protein [Ignavibacteria bacterium]
MNHIVTGPVLMVNTVTHTRHARVVSAVEVITSCRATRARAPGDKAKWRSGESGEVAFIVAIHKGPRRATLLGMDAGIAPFNRKKGEAVHDGARLL